jgi:hypothetical protein
LHSQKRRQHARQVSIRTACASEAEDLTMIAFAAKRHWNYPEKWIELWAEELTIDGRYIEHNTVFVVEDARNSRHR